MKVLSFCCTLMFSAIALAGEKPLNILGTYGDWTAYTYTDGDGKVCYMAASPEKSTGKYTKRDDVFLMVTHRPKDKTFDVVNTVAGYTYKRGTIPSITVDNKRGITMVIHENMAWGHDNTTDKRLVEQMKNGSQAVLQGTSARGTKTTDTFSLKGFSKAYQEISRACGQ